MKRSSVQLPQLLVTAAYVYLSCKYTYGYSMPKKKLTLYVDAAVIGRAKRFSRRNDTSVSELVSDFLSSLEDESGNSTPIVTRLRGILPSSVSRNEYRDHLKAKHG